MIEPVATRAAKSACMKPPSFSYRATAAAAVDASMSSGVTSTPALARCAAMPESDGQKRRSDDHFHGAAIPKHSVGVLQNRFEYISPYARA